MNTYHFPVKSKRVPLSNAANRRPASNSQRPESIVNARPPSSESRQLQNHRGNPSRPPSSRRDERTHETRNHQAHDCASPSSQLDFPSSDTEEHSKRQQGQPTRKEPPKKRRVDDYEDGVLQAGGCDGHLEEEQIEPRGNIGDEEAGMEITDLDVDGLLAEEWVQTYFTLMKDALVRHSIPSKMRKNLGDNPNTHGDILEPFKMAARWIPCSIHPFVMISTSFSLGMQLTQAVKNGPALSAELSRLTAAERNVHCQVYDAVTQNNAVFVQLLPVFQMRIELLAIFADLLAYMDGRASDGRTDNLGTLRYKSMSYLVPYKGYSTEDLLKHHKGPRGFSNVVTGRMLCPAIMLEEFDADPKGFCHLAAYGKKEITAEDYPSYLYDLADYDPTHIDRGLLHGSYLVRCFRHVFTGPRTADRAADGTLSGKPWLAKIYKMTHITRFHVAYTAMICRFIISSSDPWAPNDKCFNLHTFYNEIVKLFDDKVWADATLAWWNKRVFATEAPEVTTTGVTPSGRETTAAILARQRAAEVV